MTLNPIVIVLKITMMLLLFTNFFLVRQSIFVPIYISQSAFTLPNLKFQHWTESVLSIIKDFFWAFPLLNHSLAVKTLFFPGTFPLFRSMTLRISSDSPLKLTLFLNLHLKVILPCSHFLPISRMAQPDILIRSPSQRHQPMKEWLAEHLIFEKHFLQLHLLIDFTDYL